MGEYISTLRKLIGKRRIIMPGVRAIILNGQDEILLQRRSDMPCWGLPGGAVEPDETVLDAVRREVMEETSLQVIDAEPMALYSGPGQKFTYPNGDEVQGYAMAFVIRNWSGTPRADGVEGSGLRFFGLSDLPDDLFPIHKKTIEDFVHNFRGKFMLSE